MTHSDWDSAAELLTAGIDQLQMKLTDSQQISMIEFLQLLQKWNKAFNLTSIVQWRDMVIKHLLDSLSVSPWIKGKTVLDVGTGAGIPGVPLAIANPQLHFTLLDTNGKKTRFIKQAVTELKISNITVVQSRIENFTSENPFDQIICRAYSAISKFVAQTEQLLHSDIQLLAMKGLLPQEELDELETDARLSSLIKVQEWQELRVPYLDEQRHLVLLTPRY